MLQVPYYMKFSRFNFGNFAILKNLETRKKVSLLKMICFPVSYTVTFCIKVVQMVGRPDFIVSLRHIYIPVTYTRKYSVRTKSSYFG